MGIGRYYILILLFVPLLISISLNDVFAEVTDQDKKPMEPKEEEQIKQEDLAKIEETTHPNKENIIILYKEKVTGKNIQNLKKMDVEIKSVFNIIPGIAATIDQMYMEDLMVYDEDIENIYKDSLVHSTLIDSIPQINADKVHQKGFTGQGVKVCIVDTGVDDSHPALAKLFKEKDFVNNDDDATDDNFHGTHVAGIVASRDSIYKGVAFDSSLMAAKVLNQDGIGFVSTVISGIDWCVSEGADIISMSLGGGLFSGNCDSGNSGLNVLARASNNAVDEGVMVVAASGNNGQSNKMLSPACASKVIAVGAVDKNDVRYILSNGGTELDVVAPGVSIRSLGLGGSLLTLSGTSMATPHVSGLIALLLEKNPALNPSEIRDIVRNTALDLGVFGFDTIYGFGRINSLNAIESVPVNDAPFVTAPIDDVNVLEDAADTIIDLTSSFDDVEDGSNLIYTVELNTNTSLLTPSISGSTLTLAYTPDAFGTADIAIRGTDSGLQFVDDTFIVTVTAVNDPPVCSTASVELWPPNHKMVSVNTGLIGTDVDGDDLRVEVTSIFQDEPVNGGEDGNTSPDGEMGDDGTAQVRAERSGQGDGRVYVLAVTASDEEFSCLGTLEVTVPPDQSGTPAVNSGATYDSTQPSPHVLGSNDSKGQGSNDSKSQGNDVNTGQGNNDSKSQGNNDSGTETKSNKPPTKNN